MPARLSSQELLEKLADKLAGLARQANDQVDQTGSPGWFAPLRPHVLSTAEYAESSKVFQMQPIYWAILVITLRRIADYRECKSCG